MRRTPFCCAVIAAIFVSAHPATAQPTGGGPQPEAARLEKIADRHVHQFMKEHQVPGLVLAVVRNGQLVVERGYGVRTPADPQRPDADTLFYIGSLSKALTGVGVELLAERGKLSLDDPASRYVRGMPAAWQRIPIKLFLAHQSGIPELTVKHPTFEAMLRSADSLPLEFKPGTRQKYNNFNFAVAGKVIEEASGKSYLDFMRQEVFRPLGMTRSGFGQTDPNASPGHYLRKNGQYEVIAKAEPNGGPYGIPSGFIQTTLSDLLRLYRGIQQHKLLTPRRTRELLSPVSPGMTGTPGWFAREVGGVKIVAKNGAAAGYSSQFQFAPARGDCVIFLMNLQHQQLGTDALAQDLLRDVCGLPLGEGRRGNSEE